MPGDISARGEYEGPGDIARPTVEFAIYEIGQPSQEQTDRRSGGDQICKGENIDLVFSGVEESRNTDANQAAVKRHSAIPDRQNLQWVLKEMAGLIKANKAQTSAHDDADDGPAEEVADLL